MHRQIPLAYFMIFQLKLICYVFFTARKRICGKVMFLQASVILLTGGLRGWWGGMCGCWGGLHGFLGGMHGFLGGHVWFFWGVCMVFFGGMPGFFGGVCIGYDEIRSMSGRYASYWNAFLFFIFVHDFLVQQHPLV